MFLVRVAELEHRRPIDFVGAVEVQQQRVNVHNIPFDPPLTVLSNLSTKRAENHRNFIDTEKNQSVAV